MTPEPVTPDARGMSDAFPPMPTETEIYILPNGEIIVADMPAELAARLAEYVQPDGSTDVSIPEDVTD